MKYLVTGGAGFIGSHIVDELIRSNHQVVVFDNFSTGKEKFVRQHRHNPNFRLIKGNVLDKKLLTQTMENIDFVFHLAAHADVRNGYTNHSVDHRQNLETTLSVLEAMFKNKVNKIAFTSTSSVYGDASIHPTPETYPFEPTSLYGATKVACESYIRAYAGYYGWQAYIFRLVSFIGERYTHGIIFDLMKKIGDKPDKLELLSDGSPKKSSLYVKDGVRAFFQVINKAKQQINIYNIGHEEIFTIDEIVNIILTALKCRLPKSYLGGKRGWAGDNNFVHLDISKLKSLGWKPKKSLKEAVKLTIDYLSNQPELFRGK